MASDIFLLTPVYATFRSSSFCFFGRVLTCAWFVCLGYPARVRVACPSSLIWLQSLIGTHSCCLCVLGRGRLRGYRAQRLSGRVCLDHLALDLRDAVFGLQDADLCGKVSLVLFLCFHHFALIFPTPNPIPSSSALLHFSSSSHTQLSSPPFHTHFPPPHPLNPSPAPSLPSLPSLFPYAQPPCE